MNTKKEITEYRYQKIMQRSRHATGKMHELENTILLLAREFDSENRTKDAMVLRCIVAQIRGVSGILSRIREYENET